MKTLTSVTARASRYNPQPLPKKSVDTIAAPGRISLSKRHTIVRNPGVVDMPDVFSPGAQKLVSSRADDNVLIAGLAELKKPDAWALLQNTGNGWECLYLGKGAVESKKTALKE